MANERIRWKQRHDAVSLERDNLQSALNRALADIEIERGINDSLRSDLAAAEKRAERAKVEGARGLADFLLTDAAGA